MVNAGSQPEDVLSAPSAAASPAPEAPASPGEAAEPVAPLEVPVAADTEAAEEPLPTTFGEFTLEEGEEPDAATLAEELRQERERYAALQAEYAALEQKLAQMVQQSEEQRGQLVRLAADFENYRRRVQREQEEAGLKAKAKVLEELLAVVDSFERARTHIRPETEEGMTIHKNYQGVYKQMVEGLKRLGVSPIPGKGQPFDPNRHEAILQEASSEYAEGIIIEELRRGYFLKVGEEERVLRHALVKVSTGMPAAPPPETTD